MMTAPMAATIGAFLAGGIMACMPVTREPRLWPIIAVMIAGAALGVGALALYYTQTGVL